MANISYKTIRIREDDYNEMLIISEKSQVPIVGLVHLAVPKLKTKYRIKNEVANDGGPKL